MHKNLIVATLPMIAVLAARFAGPEDLDANDQAKHALYAWDVWEQGNWILPLEHGTDPAAKPPLYSWLVVALGKPTAWSGRVPSALSAIFAVVLIFLIGFERWGNPVGVIAAWIFTASHAGVKLCIHVRPEMLLAACVTLALFAIHRIERTGRGKCLFWFALSLAILAKGPPAMLIVLGALAFLAIGKDARAWIVTLFRTPAILFLLLPSTWFLLAIAIGGTPYLKGTVLSDTLDRALASGTRGDKGNVPGYLVFLFLVRFAPWSLLAIWRTLAARSDRSLRLPAAWAFGGLLLLGLSRGAREDYLLPLLPPAALLAASALRRHSRPALLGIAGFAVAMVAYTLAGSPIARSGRGAHMDRIVQALEEVRGQEIHFVGSVPNSLRFALGRNEPALLWETLPHHFGRRWIAITTKEGETELLNRWPGRFQLRFRRPWGERELVALECLP